MTTTLGHIDTRSSAAIIVARIESPDIDVSSFEIGALTGREAISQPFEFTLDLKCADPEDFNFDKVLGARASIVFQVGEDVVRTVWGVIARAEALYASTLGNNAAAFRFVIVPTLWRLSMTEGQHVFLQQSIPDIVTSKLTANGFAASDYEMRWSPATVYAKKPMVIQFRETDRSFVNRCTEHNGISYYFIDKDGEEKVIFTDYNGGFYGVDNHDSATINTEGGKLGVYEFGYSKTAMPRNWTVRDYNYSQPLLNVTGTFTETEGLFGGVNIFGPHVGNPVEAKSLAELRAEAHLATVRYYYGASDQAWFRAGAPVKFEGSSRVSAGSPLLITEVVHTMTQSTSTATPGSTASLQYSNTFKAVDMSQDYRPPLVTPKPSIPGILVATVEPLVAAGTADAEIDENGDYTIRFHFDPAPLWDPTKPTQAVGARQQSSCPVRMTQMLSGPDYGTHFPLRGGCEVAVAFVGGDPDRPLIMGASPNPLTVSPSTQRNANQYIQRFQSGPQIIVKVPSGPYNPTTNRS